MGDLNVFGRALALCGADPVTGFYRDGCCTSGRRDLGRHTVCAVMTREFLDQQGARGNDLVTPMPEMAFAGLEPGQSWCVTTQAWLSALEAGVAPPVVLAATNMRTLEEIPLEVLRAHAVDVPDDISDIL